MSSNPADFEQKFSDLIAKSDAPRTRESLAADLRSLGLEAGATVIVHSSLSALGWVNGGPVSVVHALMDAVTDAGTIVTPTHSYYYSDPGDWTATPVPGHWVETIRETLPPFDPATSPTTLMGQVVEVFRRWPGTLRSRHLVCSFAAWGKDAEYVTADHTYEHAQGDGSPLACIYDLDGMVLLLGVGYDRNTSFHLADYRSPESPKRKERFAVPEDGRSVWREFDTVEEMNADWLREVGDAFEATGTATIGKVGSAEARLFSQRAAVDFALGWLKSKRAEAAASR